MTNATNTLERLYGAFRAYGYIVVANPIEGQETEFAAHLKTGFDRVINNFEFNAKTYGFRGKSKRAMTVLHSQLPEPCWGVELLK